MSILLTGAEIEALEIKHKPQNGPGSFMAYSRAIQLALIEKLRKEPVGYLDGRGRFFYAKDPLWEHRQPDPTMPVVVKIPLRKDW